MIGQTLSRYKITGMLGEGGMGVVYRAEDPELGREVALKLLPAEMADNLKRLERFRREAKAVAAINHPNIVTIHSIESIETTHFLTMELVEGESLDHIIPPGGMPLAKVFEIAVPLADALASAHERGIVHRDLKPANVMITGENRIKVLDFGLAKLVEDPDSENGDPALTAIPTELTAEGMVMGTAPYMSPEQVEGREMDYRTDIFSLGIVLYEMATGKRPFAGDTAAALISSILRDEPPTVTEINESLPRHLARIIQHCLEKDPEARYQSAKDVRNELKSLRREVDSGTVTTGSGAVYISAPQSKGTRSYGLWAAAGFVAVVILAAGWWLGRGANKAPAAGDERAGGLSADVASAARSDAPSVAVLPFTNLSADPGNEYFTDGLTEELIGALVNVDGLRIPARTSVYALKETNLDVQEIGRRLGVDNILEGSVRRSGDQLRISAQLIKVSDGFNLWSETYDREFSDVFVIQDEIAGNIVEALQLTLSPVEQQALRSERTTDFKAYEYYLRGRGHYRRRTRADFDSAREMFQSAIAIDSGYALAWAGLADTYTEFWRNYESSDENLAQAEEASREAVELDPNLAEAHASRGFALGQRQLYDEAAAEFRRAMELNPRLFEAYYYYGTVAFAAGRLETAAEMFEKATEAAPDEIRALQLLPQIYTRLGREGAAAAANRQRVEVVERRLEFNPDDVPMLLDGASALAALGERQRSLEWASRILDKAGDDALVLYNLACLYSLAGEVTSSLEALEKSYAAGLADPEWMQQDSDLDNIRHHPRYKELVKRMETGG